MVLSMNPNKTIVRKQIDAIQFGSVVFRFACFRLLVSFMERTGVLTSCLFSLSAVFVDSIPCSIASLLCRFLLQQQLLYRRGHAIP